MKNLNLLIRQVKLSPKLLWKKSRLRQIFERNCLKQDGITTFTSNSGKFNKEKDISILGKGLT